MRIWKYTPDSDHYCNLALVDHRRDGSLFHRDEFRLGGPLSPPLPSVQVRYETEWKELSPSQRALARKGELPKGDFPSLYGVEVIFRERALRVLDPLIEDSIQVIPLQCDEDRLYLVHVIDVLDCLDTERSEFERLAMRHAEAPQHLLATR